MRITSNDKVSIRTMYQFIMDNAYCKQVLKRINTGSNVYTIVCENIVNHGLSYSVNKTTKQGKDIGTAKIIKVYSTIYKLEYDNCDGTVVLPDSVKEYIVLHNKLIRDYNNFGEKALNC